MAWDTLPSNDVINKTADALRASGFTVTVAETGKEATEKVLSIIPKGAEVMTAASVTLQTLGLEKELNESGAYDSAKSRLYAMDRKTQGREMQKLGAAAEWSVGSVHALTQDGHIVQASRSGSQMPGQVYGSDHVVWVVGAQKIVKDTAEGIKRIYEHSLPLESVRVQAAYGMAHSDVAKILIYNMETTPGRTHIIIVKEVLGY